VGGLEKRKATKKEGREERDKEKGKKKAERREGRDRR
jgi:hypothetical protein